MPTAVGPTDWRRRSLGVRLDVGETGRSEELFGVAGSACSIPSLEPLLMLPVPFQIVRRTTLILLDKAVQNLVVGLRNQYGNTLTATTSIAIIELC